MVVSQQRRFDDRTRRPRAPVFTRALLTAMASSASSRNSRIDAFGVKQRLILLGQGVFGSFQDLNQRFFAEFVSRRHHWQTTDKLRNPDQNLIRASSGSAAGNSSPSLALSDFAFTVSAKTNAGPVSTLRLAITLSRPANAPPQINRDLRGTSTCKNSCCGCLRPPCGGTATVPSIGFSNACMRLRRKHRG